MKLQILRSREGKWLGVALLRGKGQLEAGRNENKPWRICDECTTNPAIVFCCADAKYVCEGCLPIHTMPGFCRFLSVSAALEVAAAALMQESLDASSAGGGSRI